MKLLLFIFSSLILGCLPTPSTSVEHPWQQIQQEVDELKKSNEESITALKQKIRTQDEKIASLEQQLRSGRTLVPESVGVPVAFSTRLNADTIINDSPVIFDVVDLNIEDGHDEISGEFRPPVDGVYLLTFYGLAASVDGGEVYIKRNDDVLCQGWLRPNEDADASTCTTIAELTTGDSVRVTGNGNNPSVIEHPGFNGFLIYDTIVF